MIKPKDVKVNHDGETRQRKERKLYFKPKLKEYGQLEKLTQGTVGAGNDKVGRHS